VYRVFWVGWCFTSVKNTKKTWFRFSEGLNGWEEKQWDKKQAVTTAQDRFGCSLRLCLERRYMGGLWKNLIQPIDSPTD
jgi:hypothetical protein